MAAMSVWGRKENSYQFTLMPKSLEKLGLPLPEEGRSNFYLGESIKDIKERFSCFSHTNAWYQQTNTNFFDFESFWKV
jgi:hypothetical protein